MRVPVDGDKILLFVGPDGERTTFYVHSLTSGQVAGMTITIDRSGTVTDHRLVTLPLGVYSMFSDEKTQRHLKMLAEEVEEARQKGRRWDPLRRFRS